MFHSYLGTLLYYSFFFFFLSIIIRSSLFPRCSIFPCTRVLSCPRVSSYLSIASIPPFFLLSSPLVLCIQRSPRVLYSSTSPPYFSIFQPQVQPSLCLSFLYGLPGHPCTYLLPSSLLKSLVLPMRTRIYSTFFIRSPPNPRHIYLA